MAGAAPAVSVYGGQTAAGAARSGAAASFVSPASCETRASAAGQVRREPGSRDAGYSGSSRTPRAELFVRLQTAGQTAISVIITPRLSPAVRRPPLSRAHPAARRRRRRHQSHLSAGREAGRWPAAAASVCERSPRGEVALGVCGTAADCADRTQCGQCWRRAVAERLTDAWIGRSVCHRAC